MLLGVCLFLLSCFFSTSNAVIALSNWYDGRSTYYTSINDGNCGYGTINTTYFPFAHIAAPNTAFYNNGTTCGECYEITCVKSWYNFSTCCIANTSVVIQVSDQCPKAENLEWCSGDINHFDLSQAAFSVIAVDSCGVLNTKYRRVACNFTTNIKIVNKDGINAYWYALYVENVNNYGNIKEVQMKDSSGSSTWMTGDHASYNAWIFESSSGFVTPFSIIIKDGMNNTLSATDLITNIDGGSTFDFGANFAISSTSTPTASNTPSPTTSTSSGSNTPSPNSPSFHINTPSPNTPSPSTGSNTPYPTAKNTPSPTNDGCFTHQSYGVFYFLFCVFVLLL